MPDILVPQKNRQIEETPGQPSILDSYKAPQRTLPTYLITLEVTKQQKMPYFLAVKYDDSFVHCAKFVGFYCPSDSVRTEYNERIKETDVSQFVEVQIPWNRIIDIQNLIYRHKQQTK
jgi:hypothetical protein